MELFAKTNIDFVGKRAIAAVLSLLVIAGSIGTLAVNRLNFGIDFTGGALIEVGYDADADLDVIRDQLAEGGFDDAIVQHFGTARDVLVRIAPREGETQADTSNEVLRALPGAQMRRVEFVGPQVGEELTEQGGLAMLYALIGIFVYVFFRFNKGFSVGAVAALVHDVTITLGVLSLIRMEFDLPVVAAVLAVIGYSLNDTIVVFDRIRENFRRMRRAAPQEVVNRSINDTLSRTIMTSGTTIIVLLALFFLGGELIHPFATALLIGVVVGTYSSIYVASTVALAIGITREDFMPVQKEGAGAEERP